MAVQTFSGMIQAPTSNTTQVVTTGFQPKAILFYSCGTSASPGVFVDDDSKAFGMSDTTINHAISTYAKDTSPFICRRKQHLDACIEYSNSTTAATYEQAKVTATSATSFTLTWTGIIDSAQRKTGFFAIGGNDITNVALRRFSVIDGGDVVDVDCGFQPDMAFTMTGICPAGDQSNRTNTYIGVGFTKQLGEYAIGNAILDGFGSGGLPFTRRYDSNLAYAVNNHLGGVLLEGFVQQFLATGIRFDMLIDLSTTEIPAQSTDYYCLAIKGGLWDIRQGQSATSATSLNYACDFDPEGVFAISRGGTSNNSSRMSIGSAGQNFVGSQPSFWSGRAELSNDANRMFDDDSMIRFNYEPATTLQNGKVTALSTGGLNQYTVEWTRDGAGTPDINPRTFGYCVMRSTTGGPGGGGDLWPIFRSVVFRQSQFGR